LKGLNRFPQFVARVKGLFAGALMSQGRLSHFLCLQLLLIVLAIQAINPDAQDLASIHALQLFVPLLNDSNSPAQQDEWPDDVCDPVQRVTCFDLTPRQDQAWPSTVRLAIIRARLQLTGLNSCCSDTRRGVLTSRTDLLSSLGRMIC
jgi:hypothetical protein